MPPLDGSWLANPARVAKGVVAQVLEPPPPVDFVAWAERHVRFGAESPAPGPYNPDFHPWERFILEALSPDDPCREVTEKKSAQIGGTILALIFTLGSQDMDPGPFLYTHPTANNAVRWSRTKFTTFLNQSRPGLLATRARDGAASSTLKARPDGRGWVAIAGANSAATLSEISVSRQVQDDLAKWPDDNEAGDPEGQANSRSQAYRFAKILKIGTPGLWPGCRVTRSYKAGTQEHLHLPCPHCGHEHPLLWENLEPYIDPADPDSAHFVCPECGGAIEHRQLPGMLARVGPHSMVAHNPKARQRSFTIWAAYSPSHTWAEIAWTWLAAKGDPLKERVFYNDTLGLAYEVSGEAPDYTKVQERSDDPETGYRPGVVPAGGVLLVLAADVQGDRVEVHVKAYGRNGRRWTVAYIVVPHFIGTDEARAELDGLLRSQWPAAAGGKLSVDAFGIDGNAYTEDVWAWVKGKPRSKVFMVRGHRSDQAPPIQKVGSDRAAADRKRRRKPWHSRTYNVGTAALKMQLYKALEKADPLERGYCGYPMGMAESWYQQLTSHRRVKKKTRDGLERWQWEKDPAQRDEVLDTEIYGAAIAIYLGWSRWTESQWDEEEARRFPEGPDGPAADLEDLMRAGAQPAAPAAPAERGSAPEPAAAPAKPGRASRLAALNAQD